MRALRVAAAVVVGLGLVGAPLALWLPLDEEVCPQLYEDLSSPAARREFDPGLGAETPWSCWVAIQRSRELSREAPRLRALREQERVARCLVPGQLLLDVEDHPGVWGGRGIGDRLGGFTVVDGNVDVFHDGQAATACGLASLNLSGTKAGALSADLPTAAGARYRVHYLLAGEHGPGAGPTSDRQVEWRWNGEVVSVERFDMSGHTRYSMGWSRRSFTVRGAPGQSRLTVTSLNPSSAGPALDQVSWEPVSDTP